MRDAHRMKEKFDVSLDNRQIVSLLIAGIVVLGAVFVLGVVVGKKLAGDAQTANSPDLLSALDANAQALQEVQTTFQDELTRKAAAEPAAAAARPAAAKASAPAPAPAAQKPAEATPPKATAERPALAPTPDPDTGELPPEEPEEEAVAAAEPPKAAEPAAEKPVAVAEKPAAEKPAQAVAKVEPVSGKVEAAAVPTRTTQKEGASLKEAMARVAQPPAQAVKDGAFTLQISAFQDKGEADRFAARLRGKGYAPYIVSAEVAGKGTWYRVRMGSFATREAANKYRQDFVRETEIEAFVAGTN